MVGRSQLCSELLEKQERRDDAGNVDKVILGVGH